MYIKESDPEYAVDLKSYNETLGQLLGEWHENDTDAVAEIMAYYLTGPWDEFARKTLFYGIFERAESIIERSKE